MAFVNVTTSPAVDTIQELVEAWLDDLVTNHPWVSEYEADAGGENYERWVSIPANFTVNGDAMLFGANKQIGSGTNNGGDWELALIGSKETFAVAHNALTVSNVQDGVADAQITFTGVHNLVVGDELQFDNSMVDTDTGGSSDLAGIFNGQRHSVEEVVSTTIIRVGVSTLNHHDYSSGGACWHPFDWKRGCPQRFLPRTDVTGAVNAQNEASGVNFLGNDTSFIQAWFLTPQGVTAFDGTTNIDDPNDEIDITAHGFETGDQVVYNSGAGTAITGLADGDVNFVRRIDANSFSLHPTLFDATANTNKVTLTATGSSTDNSLSMHRYAYCIVEVSPGIYRSWGFGEGKKIGSWDGGQFVSGNWINDTGDANDTSHRPFLQSPRSDAWQTNVAPLTRDSVLTRSTLYSVNPASQTGENSNGWFRTMYSALQNTIPGGRPGAFVPSWKMVGGSVLQNQPSTFSGQSHRSPIRFWAHVDTTKTSNVHSGDVAPILEIPDVFAVNIRDMDPGTIIVDDTANFLVVPGYRKATTAPSTGNQGLLIRQRS